jgi:hypothetical protein
MRPEKQLADDMTRLRGAANRLTRAMIFASLLLSATILYVNEAVTIAFIFAGLAAVTWLTIMLRLGGRG